MYLWNDSRKIYEFVNDIYKENESKHSIFKHYGYSEKILNSIDNNTNQEKKKQAEIIEAVLIWKSIEKEIIIEINKNCLSL